MSHPPDSTSDAPRQAAIRWLEQRDPAPPFELQRRLQRAIERAPAAPTMASLLAEAAFASLSHAMRIGDDRTAANELLAADALLTYVIESVNDRPEQLDPLLAQLQQRMYTLTPKAE